jgi:hypothetical protein
VAYEHSVGRSIEARRRWTKVTLVKTVRLSPAKTRKYPGLEEVGRAGRSCPSGCSED